MGGPLAALRIALDVLADAYQAPMHPLLPRPALLLFAHMTSSLNLLEHAIWAVSTGEPDSATDVEVFRRWALEGGLDVALENVRRVKNASADRVHSDAKIVYGTADPKVTARL